MVAQEQRTGRTVQLWRDELIQYDAAPFRTDSGVLVTAYYASAEMSCFLALGWPMPENVIDLYAEYNLITSGVKVSRSLLSVLTAYGIKGGVNVLYKDEMRDLAQSWGRRRGELTWQER